ncbi:MAG TPA: sulfite exporter TauE/SafE family protein [Thermodesulfovibrionales bacterium]|nr:sulfite exporter TauE/SafE family protein [Thermodesulfovibrionales bacterium]
MFGSGLLGGFGHCIGMCGPVVAAYSLNLDRRSILPHLLYTLGRVTTYGLLGGLTGLTGSFVGIVRQIGRYQNVVLAAAGIGMIVMAFSIGGWLPAFKRKTSGTNALLPRFTAYSQRVINRIARFVTDTRSVGSFFPMGLLLGFMPCGLLYTALIAAAGVGVGARNQAEGFLCGMLLLLLFGIGTSPALLLFGKIVSMKREWLRGKLYRASALTMIVMGILFVYRAVRQ